MDTWLRRRFDGPSDVVFLAVLLSVMGPMFLAEWLGWSDRLLTLYVLGVVPLLLFCYAGRRRWLRYEDAVRGSVEIAEVLEAEVPEHPVWWQEEGFPRVAAYTAAAASVGIVLTGALSLTSATALLLFVMLCAWFSAVSALWARRRARRDSFRSAMNHVVWRAAQGS